MFEKVKIVLQSILDRFESDDIPEAIAYSTFPIPNIPATQWSLVNRTLMFIAGTKDARGFRQWMEVGRHVKNGSKAFTILAPRFVKKESENEGDEKRFLVGFLMVSKLLIFSVMLFCCAKMKKQPYRKESTSFIGTCQLKNEVVKIIFCWGLGRFLIRGGEGH